jgi:hypothetical protein
MTQMKSEGYIRCTEAVGSMCSKLMAHIRSKWSGASAICPSDACACAIFLAVDLRTELRLCSGQGYDVAFQALAAVSLFSETVATAQHYWVDVRPRGFQHKVRDTVFEQCRRYTKGRYGSLRGLSGAVRCRNAPCGRNGRGKAEGCPGNRSGSASLSAHLAQLHTSRARLRQQQRRTSQTGPDKHQTEAVRVKGSRLDNVPSSEACSRDIPH